MTKQPGCMLTIDTIRLMLHIGATEEERASKQAIDISCKLFFSAPPEACFSDRLADTVCYHQLYDAIHAFCEGKHFRLLEFLGFQLHTELKKRLPEEVSLSLTVVKCQAPLVGVEGGTSFTVSDKP